MRTLIVSAAALALAATGAATPQAVMAQPGNTAGLVDLPGMPPKVTSPIRRMSKDARTWIDAERARQLAEPGDLVELAYDIETNLGPDLIKVAKRERIDTRDLIMAIMFHIMNGAADELKSDLRGLQEARARGRLTPDEDARMAEMVARKAEIDAKVAEVIRNQTVVSRALVQNM